MENMKTTTTTTKKQAQFSPAELSNAKTAADMKLKAEVEKLKAKNKKVNTTEIVVTQAPVEAVIEIAPVITQAPVIAEVIAPVVTEAVVPTFPFKEEDIVTFVNNSGVKVKAQVLWIWYVKSTGKVRTRVIMLDEKNKLTSEHVSFVASRATLTNQVAKESTKVKFKEIKSKKVAVISAPIVSEIPVSAPVVSLVELVANVTPSNAKKPKAK